MADKAHNMTDIKLEEMEKRLSAIYSRASKEIQQTADEYFSRFKAQDEKKRKLVESGKLSEVDYKKWRKNKILYGSRFKAMQEQCAQQLLKVNQTAMAYINGELPEVYALNYNALEGTVDGVGGYSFTLTDADTVRNLATTDGSLLPFKKLDPKKDVPWNMQKINAETLQGILQGESMDKIAKRILSVQKMNEEAAIRSARTIVTNAECKGRQDSYQRAQDDGIILRKYWLATYDKRAREWHREAGNTYTEDKAIEIADFFVVDGEKMLHPGDSMHGARGHNLYNCRCSIASKVTGFATLKFEKTLGKEKTVESGQEEKYYKKNISDEKSEMRDAIAYQLESQGAEIDEHGFVTLYHATPKENVESILKNGFKGTNAPIGGMTGEEIKERSFFGIDREWVEKTWSGEGYYVFDVKIPAEYLRQGAGNKLEVYVEGNIKQKGTVWVPDTDATSTFYDRKAIKRWRKRNG